MILHGGLVAWRDEGLWRGALIRGASGAGKSDVAIRAVAAGARMVADDRVLVWRSGDKLFGRAPDALAGLAEVRGLQVLGCPHLRFCQITLSVWCEGRDVALERLYDGEADTVLAVQLPRLGLHALEASAAEKLRRAFDRLGRERRAA